MSVAGPTVVLFVVWLQIAIESLAITVFMIIFLFVCVEVLRPSQPNGSCQAPSVYLTTRLLGRLSPLSD